MSSDKPRLDRRVLEQHGVIYSETVYAPSVNSDEAPHLPDQVARLREALLDFDNSIPESLKLFFDQDYRILDGGLTYDNALPPASAYYPIPAAQTRAVLKDMKRANNEFEDDERVAKKSRKYTVENVSEAKWQAFLQMEIFKGFEDMPKDGYSNIYDAWYLEANAYWSMAKKILNLDSFSTRPTCPKPDLTYGIPINVPRDGLLRGFRGHEMISNFSIEVLGELLESRDLITSPMSGVSDWVRDKRSKIHQNQLVCFPWAVVEIKPANEQQNPVHFCYCQAANGASTALALLETLYKRALSTGVNHVERIPPIVTFTSIGPVIRVWLAFAEKNNSDSVIRRMVCIWTSTLNSTWGVRATRLIVKNMCFWASRFFKPQISSCISQIRFSAPCSSLPSPVTQERDSVHQKPDNVLTLPASVGIATPFEDSQSAATLNCASTPNQFQAGKSSLIIVDPGILEAPNPIFKFQGSGVDKSTSTTMLPVYGDSIFIRIWKDPIRRRIKVKLPPAAAGVSPQYRTNFSKKPELGHNNNHSTAEKAISQGNSPVQTHYSENDFSHYYMYKTAESSFAQGYDKMAWWGVDIGYGFDKPGDEDSLDDFDDEDSFEEFDEEDPPYEPDGEDSAEESDEVDTDNEDYVEDVDFEVPHESLSTGLDSGDVEENYSDIDFTVDYEESVKSSEVHYSESPRGGYALLTQNDVDGVLFQAARSLSGPEFIALGVIQSLIDSLAGISLFNATWRALEVLKVTDNKNISRESEKILEYTLTKIHNVVTFLRVDIKQLHQEDLGLHGRWEDLRRALQVVQSLTDLHLRDILKHALQCWGGEKCLEILGEEIEQLGYQKLQIMRREAFEILQEGRILGYWGGRQFTTGNLDVVVNFGNIGTVADRTKPFRN